MDPSATFDVVAASVPGREGRTRAVSVAIFAVGVGACYTAKSQMQDGYGVGGRARPPVLYVVLASILGGAMLVAGIIAIFSDSTAALATLTVAMVALWVMSTIRHWASRSTRELVRTAH